MVTRVARALALALLFVLPIQQSLTATLFHPPRYAPLSSIGGTLPGARLYVYQTGTTTPQNTYSDSALTTPNANPIVADGSGLFGNIYLDESLVNYKFVLKTAADVTLWTVDPYLMPSDAVSQADLGAAFYPQTAAELAAAVTPTNYFRVPGDFRRYGAAVNCSTDDTTAVTRAIAQAKQAGGVPAYAPVGCTLVNINSAATVFTLAEGMVLYGEGMDLSEIRTTGTPSANRDLFGITAAESATIRNLKITGPSTDNGFVTHCVIHYGTSGKLIVDGVEISQCTDGIKKDTGSSCELHVLNSRIHDMRGQGILNVFDAGKMYVTNTHIYTIGSTNLHHGIYHQSPYTEFSVEGGSFSGISGGGIIRYSTTGSGNGVTTIRGAHFSGNTTEDLLIDDVSGAVDQSVTVSGNTFSSASGVFVHSGNVAIVGNVFRNATKCIDTTGGVTTGENVTVSGNHFRFAGALCIELTIAGNNGWTVSGNTFLQGGSGVADTAIRIDNGTDIKIDGNVFRMNNGQPLRARTGSNRIAFNNNTVTGTTNSTGAYILSTATDPGTYLFLGNELYQTDRGITCEVAGCSIESNKISGSSPVSITAGKSARIINNDGYLTGSATYDPASLADGAGATTTVTVTGAATGDYAEASFSNDLQGIVLAAWISAANTCSVRFQNESGGVLDLASGTLKCEAERR